MEKKINLAENFEVRNNNLGSTIKENQIFVGNKPFMNYVRTAEILLRNKNLRDVTIRARGKNISMAVDLAESIKGKFCNDLNIKIAEISSSTEKFTSDGKEFSVSIIEIRLKR